MPLSDKHRRFVDEYIVDLNATQAAIRAGYSARTARQQGSRLLSHVDIADAIAAAQVARTKRAGVTQDDVVRQLVRLGFSDIRKVVDWRSNVAGTVTDPDTGEERLRIANEVTLEDSDKIDDDTAAAIIEMSQTKDGALKIKLADKVQPLVKLGLHLGMFRPVQRPAAPEAVAGAASPAADDSMEGLLH